MSSKSVKQDCPARASSKRVLSRVPCKTLLLLDDCASHLHKEKTSIFIFALVSVYSALHKVTAFGFVGSIRFKSYLNWRSPSRPRPTRLSNGITTSRSMIGSRRGGKVRQWVLPKPFKQGFKQGRRCAWETWIALGRLCLTFWFTVFHLLFTIFHLFFSPCFTCCLPCFTWACLFFKTIFPHRNMVFLCKLPQKFFNLISFPSSFLLEN